MKIIMKACDRVIKRNAIVYQRIDRIAANYHNILKTIRFPLYPNGYGKVAVALFPYILSQHFTL